VGGGGKRGTEAKGKKNVRESMGGVGGDSKEEIMQKKKGIDQKIKNLNYALVLITVCSKGGWATGEKREQGRGRFGWLRRRGTVAAG